MNASRKLIQMLHACGAEKLPSRLMGRAAPEHIREALSYLRAELCRIEATLLPEDEGTAEHEALHAAAHILHIISRARQSPQDPP